MAMNPMADSPVQPEWLQFARNPGAVGVAADCQEPHGGLPGAAGVATDGQERQVGLPGAAILQLC